MITFPTIITIIVTILGGIFVITYAFSQYKSGGSKANAEAVEAYKNELDAIRLTINRLNEQIANLQTDNKELQAMLNQLKGENKILKEALALQDPNFRKAFLQLTQSIKDIREDFKKHYEEDSKNFAFLTKLINGKKEK